MSMKINDAFVKEVRNLQESMLKPAHSMFLESETDDLSCVIRLTVEFLHHIQEIDSMDRSLLSKYGDFIDEADFQHRGRLLLELFKLQNVFAVLS